MSRGISVRLRMSLGVGRVRGGERVCRKAWVRVRPCPWVTCYHYGAARTARELRGRLDHFQGRVGRIGVVRKAGEG